MGGRTLDQFRSRQARAKNKGSKDSKEFSTSDASSDRNHSNENTTGKR